MSHTDPADPGLFDGIMFPFIDNNLDWDAFFNFEPETDDPSFPRQDASLTQWQPLGSAPQDHKPLLAPAAGPNATRSLASKANSPPVAESSASRQLATNGNTIKQDQTKRGTQDYLPSFFIDESSVTPPRKRQASPPIDELKLLRFGKSRRVKDGRCKN